MTGVSEDTRARILRAANELAEEQESVQGVTVSLESVSRRAGLTKQGLMYYYSSKENLMFGMVEHAAARWAGLLRDHTGAAPEAPKLELTVRDITINIGNRSVVAHGEPVNLTVKEFDLLQLFMNNPGKVYSRDELLETIWGFDYLGDVRTVDVHIRRLREKIEKDSTKPAYIMTKWGVGYYFAQ